MVKRIIVDNKKDLEKYLKLGYEVSYRKDNDIIENKKDKKNA